uniref:WH2 domain-containing protein n=1 Tax=Strigamia maritima TaxID=126957 RepID=T1IVP3_STRMM
MPPPPPPPPGPPPPPAMGSGDFVQPGKKEAESRGMLLSSIRQGTKLKKTVTCDRSAPIVDVGSSNKNNNNANDFSRTNGAPPGLAGLFAGGMPKLKSVGQRNFESQNNVTPLLPPNKKSIAPTPPVSRSERTNSAPLTMQVPHNTYPGTMKRPNDRGPAPQPPPLSNKPILSGNATLPRRFGPPLPNKPPVQANKPNIGPRPNPIGAKPTPPLKAPSLPAHPPNLRRPASMGEHDYRNGQLAKVNMFTSSTSQLNGSINNQQMIGAISPTQTNRNQLHHKQTAPLPPAALRMAAPPPPARTAGTIPRPPVARPPPPPVKAPNNVTITFGQSSLPHPPPLVPPALPGHNPMAPPPPPHRGPAVVSKLSVLPPPPPSSQPPPPPVRHASTRSSSCPPSRKASGDDFESKFYHKFKNMVELPPPEPYLNSQRQAPPLPPMPMMGLGSSLFARDESKC